MPSRRPSRTSRRPRFAQNGALPPDLSLIAKARGIETRTRRSTCVPYTMLRDILSGYQEAGADYVYAYLTGYKPPPAGMKLADFMNYNEAFPGHQTAMANPFVGGDGLVKYDDGTPPTVDNYARDVVAFLSWAGRSHARGAQAPGAAGDRLPAASPPSCSASPSAASGAACTDAVIPGLSQELSGTQALPARNRS